MRFPREINSWRLLLGTVLLCLALTVTFFSPRLWLMRTVLPGTHQWDRARTFLQQCEDPFRRDIEPAMFWRVLPPMVCHYAGLKGQWPLLLPFLGAVTLATYVAVLLRRREPDARFVFGGTLAFTTTSGVLVPLHWFGLNDAWVWLAQLAVAFGNARSSLAIACLLGPWVDERFIIGLPIALAVRRVDREERLAWRPLLVAAACLAPYVAIRLAFSLDPVVAQATGAFLSWHVKQVGIILPWAAIGWWMGLRAAWLPAVYAIGGAPWSLGGIALATASVSLLLAADISRSIAILLPLALLGMALFARRHPATAPRAALALGVANLLIPAGHMVYTRLDLINPLPIELVRLLRWV